MTDPVSSGTSASSPEEDDTQSVDSASSPQETAPVEDDQEVQAGDAQAEPSGVHADDASSPQAGSEAKEDPAPPAGEASPADHPTAPADPGSAAAPRDAKSATGVEERQTSEIPAVEALEDLRTAQTPDTAPEEQVATGYDLPPSYPPARRPAPSSRAADREATGPARAKSSRGTMLLVFVVVFIIFSLVKTFVVQTFTIPSGSMEDTLAVGDRVLVTVYDKRDLERGDIIVFRDPDNWLTTEEPTGLRGAVQDLLILLRQLPEDTGHILIKRVIGLPGDHIVADGKGSLTVNGVPVKEPYLKPGRSPSEKAFNVTVPEGFVWVMGDNRSNSADSRYHRGDAHGGFLPADDVLGVAHGVWWPLSNWGGLNDGSDAFSDVPPPSSAPPPSAPAPENGG